MSVYKKNCSLSKMWMGRGRRENFDLLVTIAEGNL